MRTRVRPPSNGVDLPRCILAGRPASQFQLGPDSALECCLDRIYWLAIELDEMLCLWIEPVPTPQMG
jgi:hypothetical protein